MDTLISYAVLSLALIYFIGLGTSLAIGQMPMGKKFTRIYFNGIWSVTRWTLKTLIGLAIKTLKWADKKL